MQWTSEAAEAAERLPLPPMLTAYARLECERLAREKGVDTVTAEIVAEADKRYDLALGRDVMRRLRPLPGLLQPGRHQHAGRTAGF